ncbi:MAG: TolC family protein [Methylovulum sp.]|nr:TolC family protein [Methylovulum sp.]
MIKRYSTTATVLAMALLSACTPTRVNAPLSLSSPPDWHQASVVLRQSDPADLKKWWQGFKDPQLDSLIAQALAANHDLKIATSRVREAKAMVIVVESALYPSLDFSLSGGREKRIDRVIGVPGQQGVELITPTADIVTGGLSARWEIDVFGSRHLQAEGASAQAEGIQAARHAVQVGLLAQMAGNYLELRGVQERNGILRKNIALQTERLRTVQAFFRAGLANETEVARQQTLLHSTEAALPPLTASEATLIHRLGVLLGEPPGQLASRLSKVTAQPPSLPKIPKLLPSSLLSQRPDLQFAQTEVRAAAANLGAARADLLPKFTLAASGGYGALSVGGFPSLADSVYALGSGLTAPIFNAGRIRSQITAADARLAQVATNYEKAFLLALEDVENAYVAHSSSLAQGERLAQADITAATACQFAQALYQRGMGDYLSVLDAQRTQLAIKDEQAKSETAVRVALVSLYRAFGGGWSL